MYIMRFIFLFLLTALLGSFLTACRGYSATGGPGPLVKDNLSTWSHPSFAPGRINQVVVMPLEGEVLRRHSPEFQKQLTHELANTFGVRTSLEVLNLHQPKRVEKAISQSGSGPQASRAARVGSELGAQGVLYGMVTRLEGSNDAGAPSAVGFSLWLIPSNSTEAVWSATYDLAEQPLSENLFRLPQALKEGVAFKSADTLLKEGFFRAAAALKRLRSRTSTLSSGSSAPNGPDSSAAGQRSS